MFTVDVRAVLLVTLMAATTLVNSMAPKSLSNLALGAIRPNSSPTRELEDYLLPTNIVPIEYDIWLVPYVSSNSPPNRRFQFDGNVRISFEVVTETSLIRMHARDMIIFPFLINVVRNGETQALAIRNVVLSTSDTHFLDINMDVNLQPGIYTIEITYVGNINEYLEGFYRSSYVDGDGVIRWLGVTQFQATHARRAFPCFDEPRLKAMFTLHIARDPAYQVQANMGLAAPPFPSTNRLLLPEDWEWVHYMKTNVRMSTYLVAFSVNQFSNIIHPQNAIYQIWTRPETVHQGQMALQLTPKMVNYMHTYTGQPYALPKLDQIAVPDLSFEAMENWGLIVYRETTLLFEEGVSNSFNRQFLGLVVTHEIAHQWFGNLVTMNWWNMIWLNEGFATYFGFHALATMQPTWQLERQFIIDMMHVVLQNDAFSSTHALEVPGVSTPFQANSVFNTIAYNKGGSIIRMIKFMMGSEENFRGGLVDYLSANVHENVGPEELWTALGTKTPPENLPEATSFATVMDTWAKQPGYPVITVTRNYQANTTTFQQNRFSLDLSPEFAFTERWYVPLTFTTRNNADFKATNTRAWLKPDGNEILIENVTWTERDWIVVNVQQVGYYRVNYDTENWMMITTALHQLSTMSDIDITNRAQLLDDAFALSRGQRLPYVTTLFLAEYLENEIEYIPWAAGLRAESFLYDRLNNDTESRELFETYALNLLEHMYDVINGFVITEDDSHVLRIKRELILRWMCLFRHKQCNEDATDLFGQWTSSLNPDKNNPIAPDVKSVVYCAGVRQGDGNEFNFLFDRYESASNVASEKLLILTALGCSSNITILQTYLEETFTVPSRIRSQDVRAVISAVYNNPIGVDLALDYFLDHFDDYARLSTTDSILAGLSTKLNTEEQWIKLKTFLDENSSNLGDAGAGIQRAMSTLNATLAWHLMHKEEVLQYFRSGPSTTTTTSIITTTPPTGSSERTSLSGILLLLAISFCTL